MLVGAAILAGGVLASPAPAATIPPPLVRARANARSDTIRVFYQQVNHSLITMSGPSASEWGRPQNLGGVLTSGPAAITITGPFENFANTWVFARGSDQGVRYREFAEARGTWGPWTPLRRRAAIRRARRDLRGRAHQLPDRLRARH